MPYTPQVWANLPATSSPIAASRLNYMETGITSAFAAADTANAGLLLKLNTADAPELIRDTMGTTLVEGSNVTITVNDAANTITIASTGGGGGGGGAVGYADLPAGTTLTIYGASTARPTARTDIVVIWVADTEPTNMIDSDIWFNEEV